MYSYQKFVDIKYMPTLRKRTKKNLTKKINRNDREIKYNKADYDSNNGMMTSIWGPPAWHFLHCISFNYPVNPTSEEKKHYKNFILSYKHTLPCGKCRKNLTKNLQKLPLENKHMESRETFSKYMFELHEVINTMLGKKSGLTYEIVRDRYEHFRAKCQPSPKTNNHQEKGCVVPFYGKKQKCVMRIVDHNKKCKTFM